MNEFLSQINPEPLRVANVGEDGILELVQKVFPEHLLKPDGVTVPTFDDDCAVLGKSLIGDNMELVITSDVLVEGADFLFDWMSYYDLGYKSLMVNLSDIASMGAEPVGMIVVIGLSEQTPMMQLESFLEGLKLAAEKHSVILLGGDLSESKEFFCDITVLGKIQTGRSLVRRGVQIGDMVCVTGTPGEARAGLFIALGDAKNVRKEEKSFLDPFFRPEARIDVGRTLMKAGGVRGCIDLSDGIARDISRIAKLNKIKISINAESLPTSEKLTEFWSSRGYDPLKEIVIGGEDFELLFCCSEDNFDSLKLKVLDETGVHINRIGEVMSGEGAYLIMPDGSEIDLARIGFDHFDDTGDAV